MKAKYHLKRLIGGTAWMGLLALLFAQTSFGQDFISREYRDRWYQEYENFGGYDIRKNPTYIDQTYDSPRGRTGRTQTMGVMSRVTYDPFGNFLLPGGTVYNMTWNRSRLGQDYSFDGTYSSNVFNNIMISADEFSNWQTRFMIANSGYGIGMRAFFTPSTLKITNFGGLRWDASSRKNNVTLLVQNSSSNTSVNNLYGLHWQSILGDILKVGGTFVSRQRGTTSYSNADIDHTDTASSLIGMRDEPRYVYLVLSDDSPEDTSNGARIYNVKVMVNGNDLTGQIPQRVMKIPSLLTQHRFYGDALVSTNFQKPYVFESTSGQFFPKTVDANLATTGSWFLNVMENSGGTARWNDIFSKSTDASNYGLINLPDFNNMSDPNDRYFSADMTAGYQEATGTDVVIYEFLVPTGTRKLKFNVLAANDYCLDVVAALYKETQTSDASWNDQPLTTAWKGKWSVMYDGRNCAKAAGNVKDLSNTKWVSCIYDRFTGMNVYGLNAELNWRGLYVKGEVNQYNAYFSYPLEENLTGAAHSKISARAWFVNVEKDFGKWSFGGEMYNYPNNYMRYYGTVDDNDDDDAYPGSPVNASNYSGSYEYGSDTPGMDVDYDRISDYATFNGQPYLEYYWDDVVFGDDFNHDGTIDARENDSAPDYPYERNSKGHHFFVKMKPQERALITAGYYDIKQETIDGRNQTDYVKYEQYFPLKNYGEVSLQHRSELIKYNYFRTNRYGNSGTYTLPSLANDLKNTTLFHTKFRPVGNLNVINDMKTTFDRGYAPAVISAPSSIVEHLITETPVKGNRLTTKYQFVHKADYTINIADRRLIPDVYIGGYRIIKEKRIKELKFQPMIKYESQYYTAYNVLHSKYFMYSDYRLYPIVRFDYGLAPNTKLRCGFQGFPGFEEIYRVGNVKKYTEYALSEQNTRRFIVAFENRTLYQGFNLVVQLGMSRYKVTYVDSRGRKEPGNTQYFFTVQSESIR